MDYGGKMMNMLSVTAIVWMGKEILMLKKVNFKTIRQKKKLKIQLITFKLKLLLPFSFVTTSVVASWMTLAASKGV